MSEVINITTPVGRLVFGSLYRANNKDYEGNPLVVKTGPNAGQPRSEYSFGVAIPKGTEQHWNQTTWGAQIWNLAVRAWPAGQTGAPTFSWKITDGDSAVPNRKGNKPCDREGYKGHWVLGFSSDFAPKLFNANGTEVLTAPDAIKLGYYVQVNGSVRSNESVGNPGMYLNHNMVALSGFGPEIVVGVDPTSVGFGQSPLPPGASATPIGGLVSSPASTTPALPPAGAAPPAPVAVVPNPAFLAPPPPVAPARVMTAKANGATYEAMISAGWTDATLVQHGMMAA